jgi:hypothetical protein
MIAPLHRPADRLAARETDLDLIAQHLHQLIIKGEGARAQGLAELLLFSDAQGYQIVAQRLPAISTVLTSIRP